MNNPTLSVIVPIWGVEKYIEKCARSLFESTYDNIEFVFVDDCTQDKSIEILQKVIDCYPNRMEQTIIIRHEVNKGLPQARKTGYEASHGEWITYCDSDDWVAPEMYERMLEKADEGDFIFCDFVYLSDDEEIWRPVYDINATAEELKKGFLSGEISNAVWNKLIHRRVYEKSKIQFPMCAMDEDDVLTVQWTLYAKSIIYVHECLYFHYKNMNSMTNERTRDKITIHINQQIENRKWIIDFLSSHSDGTCDDAITVYKNSLYKLRLKKLLNRYVPVLYDILTKERF